MLNRFYIKQTVLHMIYDRTTGRLVGETFDSRPVQAILKPLGFIFDERVDASQCKIPLGHELLFHVAVANARWNKTTLFKADGTKIEVPYKRDEYGSPAT